MPWEKVLAFLKSHRVVQKPENNCFRVPIHFATNRFFLKSFRLRLHCYTLAVDEWGYIQICTCRWIYIHAYTYTHKHTNTYTHAHTNKHTHTHTQAFGCNHYRWLLEICIWICTYIYILTHKQTHTHTHAHIQASGCNRCSLRVVQQQ